MASTKIEQQQSQPLKYNKTSVVLRVSIHCEGCKRKVKKILQSLPGVDDIEIERLQQRVVVTGDVTPETLITKLVKSGKKAELWPQKPKPPEIQESLVSGKEIKSPETKAEIPAVDPSKVTTTTVPSGEVPEGNGGGKVDEGDKVQVEVKVEEKKPETGPTGNTASSPTVDEKKEQQNENNGGGGGGGDGEGKKKKKKKGNGGGKVEEKKPEIGSTGNTAPVYTMSYNTAHPPVNRYTTSYYSPSPPPQSYAYSHFGSEMPPPPPQSYAYSHFGSEMPRPPPLSDAYSHFGSEMASPPSVPSDYESYRQPSSVGSFEMFSDENPNGCLVM